MSTEHIPASLKLSPYTFIILLRILFFYDFSFEAVRCQQSKIHLSAQEGGVVNIPCRYDSGYEKYPKYFYKGIYGKRTIIKTTAKTTQKGKYHLWDDTKERILHVTIHNLTLNDGGTYWCEIDAYMYDPKREIELKVLKGMSKYAILFLSAAIFLTYYCTCIHSSSLNAFSLTAPAPLKPPLVTLNPPVSTTVQTITRNQQQSARTTSYLNCV